MNTELTKYELEHQIYSAVNACNARIENGAEINEAFAWLVDEIHQIMEGNSIYEG